VLRRIVREFGRSSGIWWGRGRFLGLLLMILLWTAACSRLASSVYPEPTNVVTEEIVQTVQVSDDTDSLTLQTKGSQKNIKFERISLEQGLSQSSIYAILQDGKGFMWFGTQDGLNKYNGYDFAVYEPIPGDLNSLADNFIRAICEDRSGDLWIGTASGGLDRFDRDEERFTHYQHDPGDARSLSSDYVRAVYQDQEGVLWIGTEGGGLDRFEPETETFIHYRADPKDPHSLSNDIVWAIHQDLEGTLWIGTDGGLNRLDRQKEQFVHYKTSSNNLNSLSSNSVSAIYEDQSGVLWVGTLGGGLNEFDPSAERFIRHQASYGPYSLSNDYVRAIYQDREGTLWVGTDWGLNKLDHKSRRFTRYFSNFSDPTSLSSNLIWSIYEDRSGVLWIGTSGGGINKFNRSTERFVHYQADLGDLYSLSDNFVRAFCQDPEDKEVLWVGTAGGLDKLDLNRGRITSYQTNYRDPDSLSHNVVRAIHADQSGVLWIGTEGGGLNKFDRSMEHFTHYRSIPGDPYSLSDDTVLAVYGDRAGVLWIGTMNGGLNRFDHSTERFIHYQHNPYDPYSLSSNEVRAIYEDRTGVLWVGTGGGGLDQFDRQAERFIRYVLQRNQPQSLSDDTVLSIYEDHSGVLWVGTAGGGLNKLDRKSGTFTHYREQDGLPNDVIYGILEDGRGYLWLSTNKGLSRFNPRTEAFVNYDKDDGLQSNEFNGGAYYQSSDGEMFFGGINGFSAFYPDSIEVNPYISSVVLTSLTQGGENVDVEQAIENAKEVTFRWPNNFFEFEFAALSYGRPEKNQYAYMLEGFDKAWNYMGTRRFGRYTNLPGRTYTLRIKGSNSDGVWNEEGASITITVVPPFWATWWFRGVVALVLVGGVVGGYRLRVKGVETRNRELEARIAERTAELRQEIDQRLQIEEALRQSEMEKAVAAERSRLARDLHDAVTQTLFSASLIAEALPTSWEKDQQEGRQLLKELWQLTQGVMAEMRTLLLELRPAALIEANLGDLLRQLAEATTAREGVPVTVMVEGQSPLPADVHIALYRIAQEALNNVTKHARASQVTVGLRYAENRSLGQVDGGLEVELRIMDDGRGFDPADVPPDRLGLGNMRERAQAIGATLIVESELGRGTEVVTVWDGLAEIQSA
jgi:signal transduction histidine kinase/ligand-binding sensor domain-containing protein